MILNSPTAETIAAPVPRELQKVQATVNPASSSLEEPGQNKMWLAIKRPGTCNLLQLLASASAVSSFPAWDDFSYGRGLPQPSLAFISLYLTKLLACLYLLLLSFIYSTGAAETHPR